MKMPNTHRHGERQLLSSQTKHGSFKYIHQLITNARLTGYFYYAPLSPSLFLSLAPKNYNNKVRYQKLLHIFLFLRAY